MKSVLVSLGLLLACFTLLSASELSKSADPGQRILPQESDGGLTVVRAEYFRHSGNSYSYESVCHFINVSRSQPILLGQVTILDANANTIVTYSGLSGTVVPPLGMVRLRIDSNNIPGLTPQTGVEPQGMSVLLRWNGRPSTLKTTADIERLEGGTNERAHISLEGYDVVR